MNDQNTTISSVISRILPKYREDKEIRKSVKHNSRIFKRIQAGFQMTERYRIDFNPRREFWRPPERRVLISYFAKRWDKRYAPSQALRKYALRVFSHFDRARSDGIFTWMGVNYESMGGWQQICESLIEHAEKLPRIQEFDDLKKIWVQIDSKSAS